MCNVEARAFKSVSVQRNAAVKKHMKDFSREKSRTHSEAHVSVLALQ